MHIRGDLPIRATSIRFRRRRPPQTSWVAEGAHRRPPETLRLCHARLLSIPNPAHAERLRFMKLSLATTLLLVVGLAVAVHRLGHDHHPPGQAQTAQEPGPSAPTAATRPPTTSSSSGTSSSSRRSEPSRPDGPDNHRPRPRRAPHRHLRRLGGLRPGRQGHPPGRPAAAAAPPSTRWPTRARRSASPPTGRCVDLFPGDIQHREHRPRTTPRLMATLGYGPDGHRDHHDHAGHGRQPGRQGGAGLPPRDGSNQLGEPRDTRTRTGVHATPNTWNNVTDPWRWQPLCILTPAGVRAGMRPAPTSGTCTAPNYAPERR